MQGEGTTMLYWPTVEICPTLSMIEQVACSEALTAQDLGPSLKHRTAPRVVRIVEAQTPTD
jgi:hypothetical protein